MKTKKRYARFLWVTPIWVALAWVALVGAPLGADDRQAPIDIIIALDKSISMEEEISAVRDYLNETIVDRMLIPGDYFLLIGFYGRTEVVVSRTVESEEDRSRIRAEVSAIRADGRFTDIGNALDVLGREVEKAPNPGRRKHVLLITDGQQEAPPTSRYYSPDGSFNHEFLANTKIIQQQGWKIHVLGLGTRQEARQLAEQVSGAYTTIEEISSPQQLGEELSAQTRGFLGRVDLVSPARLSPVTPDGLATLSLELASKGYPEPVRIAIEQVRLSLPGRVWENILPEGSFALTLPAEGAGTVRIPVELSAPPDRGSYRGTLEFRFAPGEIFIPSVTGLDFEVQSVFERNLFRLGPVLAALLALIVLALILLARRLRGSRLRFKITIEGQPDRMGADVFALKEGRGLYLNEAGGRLTLTGTRNRRSVARVFVSNRLLQMDVIRQERFPKLKEIPEDIRGEAFRIRADSGKDLSVRFVRLEHDG